MVMMTGIYEGDKRCEVTHDPSKTKISTDAPKDNNGRGEAFSPTDLIGAALGSCILTTIAIIGEKQGIDIKGGSFLVTKSMGPAPRKISELAVEITLPDRLNAEERKMLEELAHTCPVSRSLHPDVSVPVIFHYKAL
ncbi:MAG: OsmC family protein [Bdellovibrionales bacterium]|nr:OsmC family protein [Bdellovibrionales bacterium]